MQDDDISENTIKTHEPKPKRTVCIFCISTPEMYSWDPDSTKTGIGGSEEAVIYLSEQLAKIGYLVTVYGNPPAGSTHSKETSNPCYLRNTNVPREKFDYIISWRMPQLGKALRHIGKSIFLWPHDVARTPIPPEAINAFEDILWLSNWQREQWISINPYLNKFTTICGNGVNIEDLFPITERKNPYSCIYGSNYSRGLAILLDIWPHIKERFPKATLDIYFGWRRWTIFTPEQEASMKETIKNLARLGVTEHGQVGHRELHKAYSEASLWTYPCTVDETYCISGIKAQASGAIPVIVERTALKDTVKYGYRCSRTDQFQDTLIKAMTEVENISLSDRMKMRTFITEEHTWAKVAERWNAAFEKHPP